MATLAAGGIGSGLDVNSIVSQLMVLERRPLDQLVQQETGLKAQLSAYGRVKSAISEFQTAMSNLSSASKFQVYTATSSNTSAFTATASTTAAPGSSTIEITQLAQAHKMNATGTYAGETGSLTINVGTNAFSVTIDSTNNTLTGIRDAINQASTNTGVTATVVNATSGTQLVLTANSTGTANALSVSGTVGTVLNFQTLETTPGNPATAVNAQDAIIKVDGFSITSSSNSVVDPVTGITLDLKQTTTTPETLTVARDTSTVTANVQAFVDAYNKLRSTLKIHGGDGGDLQGDSGLLSIERSMRGVLNTAASGLSINNLSEIGITTAKDGSLTLDSTKLSSQLTSNYSGVSSLFSDSTQGFAVRFEAAATSLLDSTNGLITSREDGLNTRISDLQSRQLDYEYRLNKTEDRLRSQFTALDTLIVQLNSTGDFLSQQLKSLPG